MKVRYVEHDESLQEQIRKYPAQAQVIARLLGEQCIHLENSWLDVLQEAEGRGLAPVETNRVVYASLLQDAYGYLAHQIKRILKGEDIQEDKPC